jgi:hypothetical protein
MAHLGTFSAHVHPHDTSRIGAGCCPFLVHCTESVLLIDEGKRVKSLIDEGWKSRFQP